MAYLFKEKKNRENIRNGLDTWFVFGGSWGSTLSLMYAIHHPDRYKQLQFITLKRRLCLFSQI